jgi:hypothetical protein
MIGGDLSKNKVDISGVSTDDSNECERCAYFLSVLSETRAACHEMNQPLQIILGLTELIEMETTDAVITGYLKEILDQTGRLSEIIQKTHLKLKQAGENKEHGNSQPENGSR